MLSAAVIVVLSVVFSWPIYTTYKHAHSAKWNIENNQFNDPVCLLIGASNNLSSYYISTEVVTVQSGS